jgi:hypothetical protein
LVAQSATFVAAVSCQRKSAPNGSVTSKKAVLRTGKMGFRMMRSSLLTGGAIVAVTLASLVATLSSGAESYAQARRNAAPVLAAGTGIVGQ